MSEFMAFLIRVTGIARMWNIPGTLVLEFSRIPGYGHGVMCITVGRSTHAAPENELLVECVTSDIYTCRGLVANQ